MRVVRPLTQMYKVFPMIPRRYGKDNAARDAVIVLLAELAKRGIYTFSEKKIQKLMFLALYVREDGERFETEELRSIIDDYRIAWFGVYSSQVRDILAELQEQKLIAYPAAEGLLEPTKKLLREAEKARNRLGKFMPRLLKKLSLIAEKYGYMSATNLEKLTDRLIGIEGNEGGAVKALMLGAKINDLIEAAKVYKDAIAIIQSSV